MGTIRLRILKWLGILKENGSFINPQQEIYSVIPEHEQISPQIAEMRPPVPYYVPVVITTTPQKRLHVPL
jgi:hypothetical protein